MTEKRFQINGKEIIQNKQVWCMANSEHCADVIATAMNELHEEIKQLRKELKSEELETQRYINLAKTINNENEGLKKELFESEKEYLMIDYHDNPVRRDDKIEMLREEFKERFGRDFE